MRLAVLDFGSLELAMNALIPGDGGDRWIEIGVPGYVIQTDDGKTILVDSGLPRHYFNDPLAAALADGINTWLRRVMVSEENLPAAQLAKLGLTPADVTHLLVTHTHFDHAGGLAEFPDATLVVQRTEYEIGPVYKRFAWPDKVNYQICDGDTDLAPGLRLLATPGHTPGHCSLMLSLAATGPVIIAIDALYLPAVLERDNFKASWNEADARASGHRLAALAREQAAWLIYGHDPDQWATIRKAPAWYE